jgi:DNA-directed RNA polymerase specialized sigma24 family protein
MIALMSGWSPARIAAAAALRIAATASASSRARRAIGRQMLHHERTLDVPANTMKTRMFYARKRISELMAAKGLNRTLI